MYPIPPALAQMGIGLEEDENGVLRPAVATTGEPIPPSPPAAETVVEEPIPPSPEDLTAPLNAPEPSPVQESVGGSRSVATSRSGPDPWGTEKLRSAEGHAQSAAEHGRDAAQKILDADLAEAKALEESYDKQIQQQENHMVALEEVHRRRNEDMLEQENLVKQSMQEVHDFKVDPGRWGKNLNTGAKIAWLGAAAIEGFLNVKYAPGKANSVVKNMMAMIDKDISAQKTELQQKQNNVTNQRNMYSMMRERFGDEERALEATRLAGLQAAKLTLGKQAARIKGERAQAAHAELLGEIDKEQATILERLANASRVTQSARIAASEQRKRRQLQEKQYEDARNALKPTGPGIYSGISGKLLATVPKGQVAQKRFTDASTKDEALAQSATMFSDAFKMLHALPNWERRFNSVNGMKALFNTPEGQAVKTAFSRALFAKIRAMSGAAFTDKEYQRHLVQAGDPFSVFQNTENAASALKQEVKGIAKERGVNLRTLGEDGSIAEQEILDLIAIAPTPKGKETSKALVDQLENGVVRFEDGSADASAAIKALESITANANRNEKTLSRAKAQAPLIHHHYKQHIKSLSGDQKHRFKTAFDEYLKAVKPKKKTKGKRPSKRIGPSAYKLRGA